MQNNTFFLIENWCIKVSWDLRYRNHSFKVALIIAKKQKQRYYIYHWGICGKVYSERKQKNLCYWQNSPITWYYGHHIKCAEWLFCFNQSQISSTQISVCQYRHIWGKGVWWLFVPIIAATHTIEEFFHLVVSWDLDWKRCAGISISEHLAVWSKRGPAAPRPSHAAVCLPSFTQHGQRQSWEPHQTGPLSFSKIAQRILVPLWNMQIEVNHIHRRFLKWRVRLKTFCETNNTSEDHFYDFRMLA